MDVGVAIAMQNPDLQTNGMRATRHERGGIMRTVCIIVAVGALLGVGALQAHAFNMTGTWKGTWSCRVQHDGTATTIANQTSVIKITQVGSAVNMDLDNNEFHYSGWARTDNENADRGATTVVECRTNPASAVYNEVISAEVKAPTGAKSGEFNGTSAFNSTEPLPGAWTPFDPPCGSDLSSLEDVTTDIGGICRYSFKRVSATDPGVGACPAAP
jgi:hypothetical protein